jgi:hypothetical protein
MITDKNQISYLNTLCRTYDGVTRQITATKNRLHSLNSEIDVDNHWLLKGVIENKAGTSIRYQGMESIQGQISRQIMKELDFFPLWYEWLEKVPGIGAYIGGNLILKYYYAFIPMCKECGSELQKQDGTFWCPACDKSVKGEGNLEHKLKIRDFPMISSWWHHMGMHNVPHCPKCIGPKRRDKVLLEHDPGTNKWRCKKCNSLFDSSEVKYFKPMLQKGVQSNWNTPGRQIGYQIGKAFIYKGPDHLYRQYYDKRRKLRDKTHPEATDMHKMNMSLNETAKMFLSHMWQVARTIDGLPLTDPYIVTKDPIHKIIPPFYWDGILAKAA